MTKNTNYSFWRHAAKAIACSLAVLAAMGLAFMVLAYIVFSSCGDMGCFG